jgi:hypothetical protein
MTPHRHDATAIEHPTGQDFCLVLAIWGDAYPDASVNFMLNAARGHSPGLKQAILFTDRHTVRGSIPG